ncbi:MAG: hypothetical protein LBP62_04310 [Clostridiales bacterium]|jgi:hypothetical protein|nr:hypothetical protein [Clostridiales bacterium]
MKRLAKLLILVLCAAAAVFSFAACDNKDKPGDKGKTDEPPETEIPDDGNGLTPNPKTAAAVFVGAYAKSNPAMGLFYASQTVVLYQDGTMEIYGALTSASVGHAAETYGGSYTLTDNPDGTKTLDAVYIAGEEGGERSLNAQIDQNGKFRAQIYLVHNMPNDDTNEDGKNGLTFYQIETVSPPSGAEYYYAGKLSYEGKGYAYLLVLDKKGGFSGYASEEGEMKTFEGTYSVQRGAAVFDNSTITFSYPEGAGLTADYNDENILYWVFNNGSAELNVPLVRLIIGE